jgi:hypothetical protein
MLIDKLIKRVNALDLNLKGKVVLTEAATGAYVVTPILAALAGAKVFAFSRASYYGSVNEVFQKTKKVYQNYGIPLDIEYIKTLSPDVIAKADIITNSGHLRPLNRQKLQYAKDRQRGFKIGATNERHLEVDVFNYLGDMAVKQIFDAGLCLYKNKFVLICNNDFGPYIAKVVSRMCNRLGVIDKEENRNKYQSNNIEWLGNFPDVTIPEGFRDAEAVILTAYPFGKVWIGKDSLIHIEKLKAGLNHPFILRYTGDVDCQLLDANGIKYFPKDVPSGHMGILPSAIGYDPIIRLQAGGLKVGEALLSGQYNRTDMPLLELL